MDKLYLPYSGKCELTSVYGWRTLNGASDYHTGVDLCGVEDKRILAPCAGVIGSSTIVTDHSDRTWEWGNYVRIDCLDGTQVYLCHLASRAVFTGMRVEVGDLIGFEGNTGYSFGQHCHMEVRWEWSPINPTPLLGIPNEWGYYANPAPSPAPEPEPEPEPEMDNVPDDYAREAVSWAVNNHILLGTPGGDLKLHEPVTRQDLLVILYRAR